MPHIYKDEKAYYQWLRSSIRRIWNRAPVKIEYKKSRRYKAPVGRNGKEVWVSDCELCGTQSRNCEVDHVEAGGSFKDWESFCEWSKRILWVSFQDIRELCKGCHEIVTLSQKNNISFESARTEKQIIAASKTAATQKAFLDQHYVLQGKNSDERKKQIRDILEKEVVD